MPLGRAAARPEGADVRARAHVGLRLGGREELGLEWRERERRELALLDHDADGGALVDAAVRGDDRVVKEQQRDRAAELGRLDEQVVEGALRLRQVLVQLMIGQVSKLCEGMVRLEPRMHLQQHSCPGARLRAR